MKAFQQKIYFVFSIASLLLSGCGTEQLLNPTVTPNQTITPTPISTLTPIPTLTYTPGPLAYIDNDRDGLSDQKEFLTGTDPQSADTDGDKISDYDEVTKYFLNPLRSDTDGDGVLDNDSNERRENTFTIKAVLKIRRPFDIETMNDHFQDATLVSETARNLTFEVVFYPDAYHIIEEIPWSQASAWYDGLDKYLQPDSLMNFDNEMSEETQRLFITKNGTDLDTVRNMYTWTERNIEVVSNAPEPFLDLVLTADDTIRFPENSTRFSPNEYYTEWDMTHLVFGKESFYNQTHGSCGSTANFHSTILRSIGIPTRIIQTIPLLDTNDAYQMSLLENLSSDTRSKVTSRMGYNHFLVEAFIGNRWIRINNSEFENHVEMQGSFIKIVTFSSWKEVDFANPWGRQGRPYALIEVSEQGSIHQPVIYNFSD